MFQIIVTRGEPKSPSDEMCFQFFRWMCLMYVGGKILGPLIFERKVNKLVQTRFHVSVHLLVNELPTEKAGFL